LARARIESGEASGAVPGRSGEAIERKAKATFLIEEAILTEVRRLVGKGGYRSLNACVNEALRMLLAHERRARLVTEMEEASRDERFLADIKATMEGFKHADGETARRLR
jgi:Arc/MetJ-type ribon-helix-helix transcriptional regulator